MSAMKGATGRIHDEDKALAYCDVLRKSIDTLTALAIYRDGGYCDDLEQRYREELISAAANAAGALRMIADQIRDAKSLDDLRPLANAVTS